MRSSMKPTALALVATLAMAFPVVAQQPAPAPGMTMPMKPGATPAENPISAINRMSRDMAAVPMTGDADRDFAGMMIPHHQGAIDMAAYELAHGKDPEMRKLARDVVAAQEREIAGMKAWLAGHPARR